MLIDLKRDANRIGWVEIAYDSLMRDREAVRTLMQRLVVLHAYCLPAENRVRYLALSEDFDPCVSEHPWLSISHALDVPFYDVWLEHNGRTVRFERRSGTACARIMATVEPVAPAGAPADGARAGPEAEPARQPMTAAEIAEQRKIDKRFADQPIERLPRKSFYMPNWPKPSWYD
ncbi:MAG: hypothetical protein ACM31O_04475 [Bacteroidota bacterium]